MSMMSLISRQTPSVRCEDYGRGATPTFAAAEYTEAARDRIRQAEDAMIARMTGDVKKTGRNGDLKWNEVRHADSDAVILAILNTPKTARQIAAIANKSENNVFNILKRLEANARVIRGVKRKDAKGRIVGARWHRMAGYDAAMDPAKIVNKVKGNETRKAALEALEAPMTASQIAHVVGRGQPYTLEILRFWEGLGEVVRTKGDHGQPDIFERTPL